MKDTNMKVDLNAKADISIYTDDHEDNIPS